MSFDSLGLSAELVRAVSEKGYSEPTPIQRQSIPVILEGRDIMAGAQTGTGKTAGFTLPLLQRLNATSGGEGRRAVRALVLTPTRELAAQVGASVNEYGKYLRLKSAIVYGGVKINPQIATLRRGVDILVATPGRLLDHVSQKTVDLSKVEILVLDEADRMLDMGFIRDIRRILALLPKQRQNLLFSATFSDEIKDLADGLLTSPALIEVARRNAACDLVSQVVHPVDRERKRELLSYLIGSQNWRQVLVFTRTKHGADRLSRQLERDGIKSTAIHGNKSQGARTRALADFKRGTVQVLTATDIAARGLDIDQLPHVVNFELPNVPEDYVHRIGRTGRAGNEGEAISLVCIDELKLLRDIERTVNRDIPKVTVSGYEPDPTIKAEPIFKGRNTGGARRGNANNGSNGQSRRNKRPQAKAAAGGNQGERRAAKRGEANGNRHESNGNHRAEHGDNPQRRRSRKAKPGNGAANTRRKGGRGNHSGEVPALFGGGRARD
ncbi:MAG: DEAD/DEAH box helicase [Pseudomonadota bacterium]|nr:MAG: DEAD/DEAH box helicase [Pseudomonadota bacterium]